MARRLILHEKAWCDGFCHTGIYFLALNLAEFGFKWFCSSRWNLRKHHKVDTWLIGASVAITFIGYLFDDDGNAHIATVATAIPSLRLLAYSGITKGFLRAAGLGIRSSAVLLPLILTSLYMFAVLGIEMFGCLDGLHFGAADDKPHASFDTLEYSLVTMLSLYLGEELDPVRQHIVDGTRNSPHDNIGPNGVVLYFVLFQVSATDCHRNCS